MKTAEMTADQVRACSLVYPNNPPKTRTVEARSGDWLAYPGKSEVMKRWTKIAKKDLRDRELRGGSYPGDIGHVEIGGKRFGYYPKSGMLIRDDFARWCDANWSQALNADGSERLKTETRPGQEITKIDELLHIWKDVRKRVAKFPVTGMMSDGSWNTVYDMKATLSRYSLEIHADEKAGKLYGITKILADQLATCIAYRERDFANTVDFLLDLAAVAISTAKWVQDTHAVTGTGGAE